MWCPSGHYELENTCSVCGRGTTRGAVCREEWPEHTIDSGTTLRRMVLEKSFWRASVDAEYIHSCTLEFACKGGGENGTAEYCYEGYEGPLCGTARA